MNLRIKYNLWSSCALAFLKQFDLTVSIFLSQVSTQNINIAERWIHQELFLEQQSSSSWQPLDLNACFCFKSIYLAGIFRLSIHSLLPNDILSVSLLDDRWDMIEELSKG